MTFCPTITREGRGQSTSDGENDRDQVPQNNSALRGLQLDVEDEPNYVPFWFLFTLREFYS